MKQAILVVSFGTSHLDTLHKNIEAIERTVGTALADFELRRAFTSGVIRRKLENRDGIRIDSVPQALEKLAREGFDRVIVQPTHIINGEEYNKLLAQAAPFAEQLQLRFGTPLLTSISDYKNTVAAVMSAVEAPGEEEALIFMGHGTAHYANSAYALMEMMLHDAGWERVFVGTVEGYPELEQVLCRIRRMPRVKKIRLQPMMVVAGDHANNDMAGEDPDSWKNQLLAQGYQVECCIRGLGEYEAVRQLFARHALEAISDGNND